MENSFGCREIRNSELSLHDVPSAEADLTDIFEFALTYDGYAHHPQDCGELANAAAERYRRSGMLPETLDGLRNCLFFEQRRWHHFGYEPDAEARAYFGALLEAIREQVSSR